MGRSALLPLLVVSTSGQLRAVLCNFTPISPTKQGGGGSEHMVQDV